MVLSSLGEKFLIQFHKFFKAGKQALFFQGVVDLLESLSLSFDLSLFVIDRELSFNKFDQIISDMREHPGEVVFDLFRSFRYFVDLVG